MRRSPRGPARPTLGRECDPGVVDSGDLEVESALREADLALAEAEMITVSQRDRKRIFDLAAALPSLPAHPNGVSKEFLPLR